MLPFIGEILHSLCVVQKDCIDVLSKDGALFAITLPFSVSLNARNIVAGNTFLHVAKPGNILI